MDKIEKMIESLTEEFCESKDSMALDTGMKYADIIKDLAAANYHMKVTESMEDSSDWNSDYENAKKSFESAKTTHNSGTDTDETAIAEEMSKWVDIVAEDMKQALVTARPRTRTIVKQKLTAFANTI